MASRPRKCHHCQSQWPAFLRSKSSWSTCILLRRTTPLAAEFYISPPAVGLTTEKWQWETVCKVVNVFKWAMCFCPSCLIQTASFYRIAKQVCSSWQDDATGFKTMPIRLRRTTYHLLTISKLASVSMISMAICRKALADVLPVASTHSTKINIRRVRSWRPPRAWVWHKSARC